MNLFDVLSIIILGYGLVRGLFRGLLKELASIIGVIGGFYLAYSYYGHPAGYLKGFIENPGYRQLSGFLIIFCTVLVVVAGLAMVLKYLLNIVFLGWVDRAAGAVFGLLKGVLIVSVLFLMLTAFLPKGTAFLQNSLLAPHVSQVSEKLANVVPLYLKKEFAAKLKEFKKAWNHLN